MKTRPAGRAGVAGAVGVVLVLAGVSLPGSAATRRIALVLDTSGSMVENDPQRYTVQATKILADLIGDGDALDAIRIPGTLLDLLSGFVSGGPCAMPADRSLALSLLPGRRLEFKDDLDSHVQYGGGTYFAAPLRTAARFLKRDPAAARMLLIVADEGGLGPCAAQLTRELLELRGSGVLVAQIHLGVGASAFRGNPAFDFTKPASDARALLVALAQVYQRFIGGEHVQTGKLSEEFTVDILPGAKEAFVVVSLDGELADAEVVPGHPFAAEIDTNYRGGGFTMGLDGVQRSYRIVRLRRPAPGPWRLRLYGAEGQGGWLLIQDYGKMWQQRDGRGPSLDEPTPQAPEPASPKEGELRAGQSRDAAPARSGSDGESAPSRSNGNSSLSGSDSERAVPYTPPSTDPPPAPSRAGSLTLSSAGVSVVAGAALHLPRLGPRAQASAVLDLTGVDLSGVTTLAISSDLRHAGATLEIQTAAGWQRLAREPVTVTLAASGPRAWRLRLWTGRCPEACAATRPHAIDILASGAAREPLRLRVPLAVELSGVSRLRCYGPRVLGLVLLAVGVALGYAFLAPRRPSVRPAARAVGRRRA